MGLLILLVRRITAALLVVIVVSFIIFSSLYLAPGSPEQAILGPTSATPETIAQVRVEYGLDRPFLVQFWSFLQGVAQFDFGHSYQTGESVLTGMMNRLEVTLPLAFGGLTLSILLGVSAGVLCAHRQGGILDRVLGAGSIAAASLPAYATAIILMFVFGVQLGWFPVTGEGTGAGDRLHHLILPMISLGLIGAATFQRRTRVEMVAALDRDDVAFARARGVGPSRILFGYTLRHSAVILVTSVGVVLIFMVAGTAVVETAFALNGIGSHLIASINTKDIPSIQGIAMMVTILVVVVSLITDVCYALIDPRIQQGATVR